MLQQWNEEVNEILPRLKKLHEKVSDSSEIAEVVRDKVILPQGAYEKADKVAKEVFEKGQYLRDAIDSLILFLKDE